MNLAENKLNGKQDTVPLSPKFAIRKSSLELAVPAGKSLYPFQKEAVQASLAYLAANESNGIYNCCQQGLGKSAQTIVTLNILKAQRVLIVAPAVAKFVWESELKEWGTVPRIKHIVNSGKDDPKKCSRCQLVIISYNMISNKDILAELLKYPWDALVLDEAQYLQSRKSLRSKTVFNHLWNNAKYKIACSGTPMTNRVITAYPMFHALMPSRFKDFWSFANEWSYVERTRFGHNFFGIRKARKLSKIIRSNFFIRYTKEQVLPDLPSKTYTTIKLPETYSVTYPDKKYEEQLKLDAHIIRKAIESDKRPAVPASLAEHRRLQGELKLPPIIEFITDLLEQQIPVVCFGWHRSVLAKLHEAFAEYKPSVITGDTPAKERKELVAAFQEGKTDLFLGNLVAAGVGITLTRSSTVVLAELSWTPSDIEQGIDRCHRIGTKSAVNIYSFVVRGSLDEVISSTVMARSRVIGKVVDG